MTRACGSSERGVGLELDALLEVDQVELDLVGAVAQGQVGDQHVQQGRLARAGLAGDQHVLRGAAAELRGAAASWPRPGPAARRCRRGCRRSTTRPSGGAMHSNGTSTRPASLASLPTTCRISVKRSGVGRRCRAPAGSRPKSGSLPERTGLPSSRAFTQCGSRSWQLEAARAAAACVSTLISA